MQATVTFLQFCYIRNMFTLHDHTRVHAEMFQTICQLRKLFYKSRIQLSTLKYIFKSFLTGYRTNKAMTVFLLPQVQYKWH